MRSLYSRHGGALQAVRPRAERSVLDAAAAGKCLGDGLSNHAWRLGGAGHVTVMLLAVLAWPALVVLARRATGPHLGEDQSLTAWTTWFTSQPTRVALNATLSLAAILWLVALLGAAFAFGLRVSAVSGLPTPLFLATYNLVQLHTARLAATGLRTEVDAGVARYRRLAAFSRWLPLGAAAFALTTVLTTPLTWRAGPVLLGAMLTTLVWLKRRQQPFRGGPLEAIRATSAPALPTFLATLVTLALAIGRLPSP
jgi:hypothetical protein